MTKHQVYPSRFSCRNDCDNIEPNDSWICQEGELSVENVSSSQIGNRILEQDYKNSFLLYQESNLKIPSTPKVPRKMKLIPLITEKQSLEHYQKSQLLLRSSQILSDPMRTSPVEVEHGKPILGDSLLSGKYVKSYVPYSPGQSLPRTSEHVQPRYQQSHLYSDQANDGLVYQVRKAHLHVRYQYIVYILFSYKGVSKFFSLLTGTI